MNSVKHSSRIRQYQKVMGLLALMGLLILTSPANAQSGFAFPSNYDVVSAVPRGCLTITPLVMGVPSDQVILDGVVTQPVQVPGLPFTRDVDVRVRVWRHGCHEPNRSAILMHVSFPNGIPDDLSGNVIARPVVSLRNRGQEDIDLFPVLWNQSVGEVFGSVIGIFGLAPLFDDGITYLLDTQSHDVVGDELDDLIRRYNGGGELVITNITGGENVVTATIPAYDVSLDLPQRSKPVFTGRMTGNWIAEGLPSSGLILQVGEVPRQERNFLFAIWFTFIDGMPVWLADNKDIPIDTNEITLDMALFEGGELFTAPNSFTNQDVSSEILGTMNLRMINCNEIEMTTDFSQSGFGTSTLKLVRLVRVAGYDCDGTQGVL